MKSKKIVLLWLLLFIPLMAMAKKDPATYVVSKVSGGVELVTPQGKRKLEKGDVLKGDAMLNISFTGSLTLLTEDGDKQYILNAPGKASLDSFLADKRNTVLTLTKDYVKSVVAQLRKDKTVKARRHSDPATVTREIIIKDSLFVENGDTICQEVETDTIPCKHVH